MTLTRSRPFPSHDWPEGYKAGPPQTCTTCHTEWREGFEAPPPWPCKRSPVDDGKPPQRKKGLPSVSDRRDEKRSSPVTGEKLVNTEACGWVVRQGRCYLARAPFDHSCSRAPDRDPIEPAHVKPRIRGYDDWIVREGEVLLNVVGACPEAHDLLDGQIRQDHDDRAWRQFYRDMATDEAARLTGECPIEPPEHYRLKADGELV